MAQALRKSELARHFPVGAVLAMGATTTMPGPGGVGTQTPQCNNVAGLTEHLKHPTNGLIANGLNYVMLYLGSPYFHEEQQDLPSVLDSNNCWGFFQVMSRRTSDPSSSLTTEFTTNTGVDNSRAVADPLTATVVSDMALHPSILSYVLDDDIQKSNNADKAARNNTLTQSLQAQDNMNRLASAMWRDRGYVDLGNDLMLMLTYEYGCGADAGGTPNPEGDLHRATFPTITGTSNPDMVDIIRHRIALLPSNARHMWMVQCHYTNTGTLSSRLRQVTDRELRLQVGLYLAEGATGLWFFPFTDFDIGGGGGIQPMLGGRASSLAVSRELSSRLTPTIRRILLKCTAAGAATAFTASGGGSTGYAINYANAHVGELTHKNGKKYVVIVNRGSSTANVTISHPNSTGYLLSLENSTRYKLGTDAISIGAFDWTILVYEPSYNNQGSRGVPNYPINFSQTVKQWWASHWLNPTSANYVNSANFPFHTREVSVPLGANLQAYIDAAQPNTTLVLPALGAFGDVTLLERSNIHFRGATSVEADYPTIECVRIYGSRYAQQYNTVNTDYGYVAQLYSNTSDANLTAGGNASIRSQARRRFLREPSRDIVFDRIRFKAPASQPIVYYKKYVIDNTYQTDHWYEGSPISCRTVERIHVQRCIFEGYKWGSDNSSVPPNNPQENNVGPVSHPGLFWGNSGIHQITLRDNQFLLATNVLGTGSPSPTFFDGCQGYAAYNNTVTGKLNQDAFNFLTNDDYTQDMTIPGLLRRQDKRMSRYIVISTNVINFQSGALKLMSIAGEETLVTANDINMGTSTSPALIGYDTKVCRLASTMGVFYESYNHYIENNDIECTGLTKLAEWNVQVGYTPGLSLASPVRSRVGKVSITGNVIHTTVGGNVTPGNWHKEDANSQTDGAIADGPHTISGNTPTQDGAGAGV